MALPQCHRLKGQRRFDALYQRGKAFHGASMVLRTLDADPRLDPTPLPSAWRLGVVISAKVHKRAVRRNRLRRLLHQDLLTRLQAPLWPGHLWLLLSLKPGSAELDEARLLGECRHLLHKAGLLP